MFYNKLFATKQPQTLKLNLTHFKNGINTHTDENLLPLNYAKSTYNYSFISGALREGIGFNVAKFMRFADSGGCDRTLTLSDVSGIEGIWLFRHYSRNYAKNEYVVLIYTKSQRMFYSFLFSPLPMFVELNGINFTSCPQVINYRLNEEDVLIMSSQDADNKMYTWNLTDVPDVVLNTPEITSMCIHNERLFATTGGDRKTLYFSDDLDPTNWRIGEDQAGYIEMVDERGGLNKVISFGGHLFVLRDYGISRLSAWGAQNDFNLVHLFTSSGKIYSKTAVLCGDRILMLCADGFYTFDGVSTTKRILGLEGMFDGVSNEYATAEYHQGKYYLACRLNFGDDKIVGDEAVVGHKNNAVIEYDVKTGEYSISRGIDICRLCSVQEGSFSKLLACFNTGQVATLAELDYSGTVFLQPSLKVWQSPETAMGYPDKIKVLKTLTAVVKQPCKFVVHTESATREFELQASTKPVRVKINMPAKLFSFEFVSEEPLAHITNPQLVVSVV